MTNFINRLRDGENIVLWIGDILGKLMGYPSKKDLAKLIYEDLDKYSKLDVADTSSLAEVCQVYLDSVTGSKLKLLNKLRNSYSNSKATSDLLYLFPKSPFVSAVVTTNFDTLIENSYGSDILKVDIQNDSEIKDNLPRLYKINGDFEHLDKMLVTKQDFRKLKSLSLYDPLFENLKRELKDKLLLFIGYDLEDPDTREILSFVYNKLGDSRPNAYFVTSSSIINTETINWLNSNEIKLLKQNEIEFLNELKKYLIEKQHILETDDKSQELSVKKKYR
ncbi:SIR2 family protein [uncultured Ilyobacter sp.]|uniref:SIR2 family NAD-dependent protein deacylase n=1 Tax=uncultured Ilyobacter sp. TaxID=544433 RepID=UPI0029BFCC20|nr:SIR2 family protein [uncultured Ilyobacter sp.]